MTNILFFHRKYMGMPLVSNAEVNIDKHHIDELPKNANIPIDI